LNIDLIRRYADLHQQKAAAEQALDGVKKEIALLDPIVRDEMISNGVTKLPIETDAGPMTVYVWRILNTRPAESRADVVAALRACGWGELVKEDYNANTLSAAVRERLAGGEQLPAELAATLNVEEHSQARVIRTDKAESTSARASKTLSQQGN
jgi:hypothetical protein